MSSSEVSRPLPLHQILKEEYETLNNEAPPRFEAVSSKALNSVINAIHLKKHSALCLSGGGIRSATFALGVLQGMARKGLLDQFSYLSTVSGGGYVGGCLSAWIHRHPGGVAGVVKDLVVKDLKAKSEAKLEPEPKPIQHLRSYSNYLTPRLGIFSADTWTLAAIVLRNMILNWLVLIPVMLVVLTIPRLAVAAIRNPPNGSSTLYVVLAGLIFVLLLILLGKRSLWFLAFIGVSLLLWSYPLPATLLIGFIGGVMSITYVGIKRPSSNSDYNNQKEFLKWCLLPLLSSAVALTTFWAWFRHSDTDVSAQLENVPLPAWTGLSSLKDLHYSIPFIIFGLLLYMTGWTLYSAWRFWKAGWRGWFDKYKVYEFLAMLMSGAIGGVFLWLLATKAFYDPISGKNPDSILYYVSFASPSYLVLFLSSAMLFAGISSEFTVDEDREWWARFGAWILISITVWSAVGYLSLLGPHVFEYAWGKYIVPAGGIIGFVTTRLAQSDKSPANVKQEQNTGWKAVLMNHMLPLGALLFIALLIVLLTYGINYLLAILTLIFNPEKSKLIGTKIMGDNWLLTQASMPYGNLYQLGHMIIIRTAPFRLIVVLVVVIGGLGYFLSRRINTNKFSHHAMYRNRLIRAYLGASNQDRFPNPFTGFDSTDNIPMYELRPEFFHHGSFKDIRRLMQRLKVGKDDLSKFFRTNLSHKMAKYLDKWDENSCPSRVMQRALIEDLNKLVQKPNSLFDDTSPFTEAGLTPKAWLLHSKHKHDQEPLLGDKLILFNRRLIESAFKEDIRECPEPPHKPLHVVNMALNLVRGKNLAWQDRKAESFTVSPLHSGSCQIPDFEDEEKKLRVYGSYRRSKEYGGKDDGGISLGTAVAISGAAVSPNMGYYSSPLVTFLMTLFNVRLGWWLGNPGKAGRDYYYVANPKSSAYPILAEALGLTDDENSYVYLSDGGHFENLGLYEMVLRRCHTIVVIDASDDFEFRFDNLGNAISKIRVDFGIPIEFDQMKIYPRSKATRGAFCDIGHIKYSLVDEVDRVDSEGEVLKDTKGDVLKGSAADGILVYIKPVFYGDEPRDIYHYAQANRRFPHESTVDQWFSEEQFESYRSLGLYIMGKISGKEYTHTTLDGFTSLAREHVKNVKSAL